MNKVAGLEHLIERFNKTTGGSHTTSPYGGPLTGSIIQSLLLGGLGYGVGNLGARASNWLTDKEIDPHRMGMVGALGMGAIPVASHMPSLIRNFQLSRALPVTAIGERLRTMNLPGKPYLYSQRPGPDARYWQNVDPKILGVLQSVTRPSAVAGSNLPNWFKTLHEEYTKRGSFEMPESYGATGAFGDYDTFLPPERSGVGFPAHATAYQIENDPYLSPVVKAKAMNLIGMAAQNKTGLIDMTDVTRAGVGAGLGYATASLFGKVLDGVFGGLDKSTRNKLQMGGAIAGLLMNTGIIKGGSATMSIEKAAALKRAFKKGFCEKLAELGIAPSRLEKQAGIWENIVGALGTAANVAPTAFKAAVGGGLILTPALTGWALGETKRTNQADIDYLTQLALLEDYKRGVDLLKRNVVKKQAAVIASSNQPIVKTPGIQVLEAAQQGTVPGASVSIAAPKSPVPSIRGNIERAAAKTGMPVKTGIPK